MTRGPKDKRAKGQQGKRANGQKDKRTKKQKDKLQKEIEDIRTKRKHTKLILQSQISKNICKVLCCILGTCTFLFF